MYILCVGGSRHTGRLLATKLGLKSTVSVAKLEREGKVPILRYGRSDGDFDEETKYNPKEGIHICGNSLRFSNWCQKNDVESVVYTPITEVPHDDLKFPFFLRKAYHSQGRDIIIINSLDDLEEIPESELSDRYYVPYIPMDTEITIHVFNGKVIKLFKKKNGSGNIRTSHFGWRYSLISDLENNFRRAQKEVLEVFEKVGLSFGRADVGYSRETGVYTLFEINTAPSLTSNLKTLELYTALFREVLKYD
jgi:carbamoylphosphate synthase large subunit